MAFGSRTPSARPSADAVARARGFGMVVPDAPQAPSAPAARSNRVTAILSNSEAIGREGLARHLAHGTAMGVDDAVGVLAAAPRSSALGAALGGAVAARQALGLPPDPERDAQLARGIEAVLGTSGYSESTPAASQAEDFVAGAAAARKLLGR